MKTESFKFENGLALRVIPELKNETAWFVAKDACDILEIQNTAQAVDKLDEDEKLIYKLHISGQERDTWCINEFGLYSLILTSNKSEAKAFKRWITHDVLPSIRKAGIYSTDDMNEREEKIQQIISEIEAQEATIKDLKAKATEKEKLLKLKQTELKQLLKADIRQLRLNL